MEKGKGSDFSERKLNHLLVQLNKTEEELHQLLGDNFAQVLANHPSTIPPLRPAAEHEQRSHALIENALDLVSIMSADGTILYEGPSSEHVLGYAPHEIQGKNVYDLVHRDDAANIQNLLETVLAEPGRAAQTEARFRHKDGTWRVYEETARNLVDNPAIRGVVVNTRDVTERKAAEAALQEAHGRLQAIVDNAPVAIVTLDLNGNVTLWNAAAEKIFGWIAQEVLGKPLPIFLESHAEEAREIAARVRAGVAFQRLQRPRKRKDGSLIQVNVSIAPLVDASGNLMGHLRILEDITELTRAEEALRAQERLLTSIYENVPDALFLVSVEPGDQFRYLTVNKAFLRNTRLTMDDIVGQRIDEVLPESSRAFIKQKYKEAVGSGKAVRWEQEAVFSPGNRIVAVSVTPINNEAGAVSLLVGTGRDITPLRLAQESLAELNAGLEEQVASRTSQLEAANTELEAFSYSVSHDLRAPLRAIDGFSRILMEEHGPALSEDALHYLKIVRASAVNMGQLIDDLLRFSRASRQPLSTSMVNPAILVRRCLEDLRHELEGRQIDLQIGELAPCQADERLLQQVWMNLLSNALKFTRKRDTARIHVGNTLSQGELAYFVRDNGAGFDMRYRDKLFEVFQRLHRAEEYEGTGIGLALANRIIQRHGGRMWAESEVDNGATFYFTVEAADAHAG